MLLPRDPADRARLGFDGTLLGVVARTFVDSVLGWYRRRVPSRSRLRTCRARDSRS